RGEGQGWTYGLYQGNRPGLGWVVWPGWFVFRFAVDLGNHQSGSDHPLRADSRVPKAHGPRRLSRGRGQLAAVECFAMLSGRFHALVVSSIARRKFPAHDERAPGPVSHRYRRQLPASSHGRKRACTKGPAVVRGNDRILGWNDADYLDQQYSTLDHIARD